MRVLRLIGYGFMALVLAGGWAFIYWQSSAVDLAAVEGARAALAELRAADAGWNQQLVNAQLPARGAADAEARLVVPSQRYRLAYAKLEVRALRLGDPQVGRELAQLKRAFEEKAALLTRFAETQKALVEAQRAEPVEEARLAALRASIDELFGQAWYATTGPRLETLGRAIDRAFDEALTQAEFYRVGLLLYSGFLLAVLAFLVWSLDLRGRQLREANESLEARVRDRTRDLSEALAKLKESEAMLIQSEKMSSLGQMVAGIAHEVNTPLAYVKSSLDAVGKSVPRVGRLAVETERLLALLSAQNADEAALGAQFALVRGLVEELAGKTAGRSALEELERLVKDGLFGIDQISEIVTNLKNFSRLDRSMTTDFDLHEGIESSIRIGHAQLEKRIVQKQFGAIPRVSCSPSQINQVILNLLSNAAQATRDGDGTITVRTALRDAAHVVVEVTDNGSGIPADVLPKIFDPFFTTKAVGKGTGLGLSVSYKIIENHGGKLEVQSKPGTGTRFTIVLPINPPAA